MTESECKLLIATGSIIPVNDENLPEVLLVVTETVRVLYEENYFSSTAAACKATYSLHSLMMTELADGNRVFESHLSYDLNILISNIPKLNLGYCMIDMTREELRKLISMLHSIVPLGEKAVCELINIYYNRYGIK